MQRFSFRHLLNVQETLPYYVVCLYMLSLDIVSVLATFTFTNDVLKHVHTHTYVPDITKHHISSKCLYLKYPLP